MKQIVKQLGETVVEGRLCPINQMKETDLLTEEIDEMSEEEIATEQWENEGGRTLVA